MFRMKDYGNFFNLHKCKMATARYVNMCYTRTACDNVKFDTSFKGSFVPGIQIYCPFFISRSMLLTEGQRIPNVAY